jgi:hypothetical protein
MQIKLNAGQSLVPCNVARKADPGYCKRCCQENNDVAYLLAVLNIDAPLSGVNLLEAVAVLWRASRDNKSERLPESRRMRSWDCGDWAVCCHS